MNVFRSLSTCALPHLFLIGIALCAGCATTPVSGGDTGAAAEAAPASPEASRPKASKAVALPALPAEKGTLMIDITTVLGENLSARVDLHQPKGLRYFSLPVEGTAKVPVPVGDYEALVYTFDDLVPLLVEVKAIAVRENETTPLLVNVLEGAGGNLTLRNFDRDSDLALDRVELDYGTDPENAASVPGFVTLPMNDQVVRTGGNWYRGDLHAYSEYSGGSESVGQLIRRAEKSGLDFLAITDLNTVAHLSDPDFRSSQLALIPAMAWGNDTRGYALIYGMRTEPQAPVAWQEAQANCYRVQAQSGVFAIAHPASKQAPWQWGLEYVNAVEVWYQDWRMPDPITLTDLSDALHERKDGFLVHSIAAAAASADKAHARLAGDRQQIAEIADAAVRKDQLSRMPNLGLSGNVQSTLFWDYELVRGLHAGAIGGSGTTGPKSPLAKPVTYIYAENLSAPALIEGLRYGRTYISAGLDGPQLVFRADSLGDGKVDVQIGGVVPLNIDIKFYAEVRNAIGKKLEIIRDGHPVMSRIVERSPYAIEMKERPTYKSIYRLRVVGAPANAKAGHGPIEVFAMSSPIYAEDITQELLLQNPNIDPNKTWIKLESDDNNPDANVLRPDQGPDARTGPAP
ncbi:MAG: hypothetical protein HYV27_19110 [Candidatus Hydrogenedentes bacterium]|nr:hypothetical protein [Candidatus Hydrogenedentota bacterium]